MVEHALGRGRTMSFKDLAKDAAIIGAVQVVVNVASFLFLPLITKTLGSGDYGIWGQILVTLQLLSSIALLGQNMTVLRFASAQGDRKLQSRILFTAITLVAIAGIVIAATAVLVAVPLATLVFSDGSLYGLIMVTAPLICFTALNGITTSFFRAVGHIRTYAALILFKSLGEIFLAFSLILVGQGVGGAIFGLLIVSIISFIIGFVLVVRIVGISGIDGRTIRDNLRFGLPLTPNYIIEWVTTSSDRYIIAYILGLSMVGIYSAAYSIGGIIFLFIAPIQLILYPTLSRLYDENRMDDVKDYVARSFRYYFMITFPAAVGLFVLSSPLIKALTTPEFASGAPVIPFVALAGLFAGIFKFVENVTHLVKKTHLNMIMFIIPAALNVVLVTLFTPIFGIVGAAMASMIAFGTMLLIGIIISRKFLRFSIDYLSMAKSIASSSIMAVAIFLLNPSGLFEIVLVMVVGIAVYFGMLYLLKGFTAKEISLARSYLSKVLSLGERERSPGRGGP